jgi:hypothetical protein
MDRNTLSKIDRWTTSATIINNRLEFIEKEIEELNLSKGYKKKFSASPVGSLLLEIGKIMATLKPITEKMLRDYILGIFGIPISISRNDENFNNQIDELLKPSFDILTKYLKSDTFRLSLIDEEVSGDEVLKISGLEIPLSRKSILLHIKRTNSLPLKSDDIAEIQKDFVRYKKNQFSLPSRKYENTELDNSRKKISASFYALYHLILVEMGREKHFERDHNDLYSRKEIEAFAKNKYPAISTQAFYKEITQIDITNKFLIRNRFGKDYKKKIVEISNNDAQVIEHLKGYPN